MKAFWWFKENEIAGMARPGFNGTRWFDFPFAEAVLVGWLGQHPSGSTSLSDLRAHVQSYGTKISKFYKLDAQSVQKTLELFEKREGLLKVFSGLATQSQLLENYDVTDSHIHFAFDRNRLHWEISYLREQGVEKVVALTESHHNKDALQEHFGTFHFSINDLDAPSLEQVVQLSEIIRAAQEKQKKVAVHCLAGIGRTSTMLIGAHMVMGERLENLKTLIARQNPTFVFAGKQAEFIHSLAEKLGSKRK